MAVDHGDVVVAVLAAAGGLAGIVLVFLGLIIGTYQSFEADTQRSVLGRYRRSSALAFGAFFSGMAAVVLAMAWLIELRGHQALYVATLTVFMAQIAMTVVAAGWTVWTLIWGD